MTAGRLWSMPAWHGCLDHNRDHCTDCRTCDHYAEVTA